MKTTRQPYLLLVAFLSVAPLATAQNTAFTYQGRLADNGVPVNGDVDMIFALYGSDQGDDLIRELPSEGPTTIIDGLFSKRIDFGPGIFTGPDRWLEVWIRPVGTEDYTALKPRVEITSSPYAIRAREAASLPDGALTASQLRIAGAAPAAGNVLGFDGADFVWTGGGSGLWSVLNSNLYYEPGSVGIGTANPLGRLHLYEPSDSVHEVIETGGGINAWAKVVFKNLNGQWEGGKSRGFNHDVFYLDRLGNSQLEFQLHPNGSLGLGIEPQAKLHMYVPNDSVSQLIETGGGINAWAKVSFRNLNGQWDIGTSRGFNHDVFYLDRLGNNQLEFQLHPNGSLGLGIEPQAKLHMYVPDDSITHLIQTDGGVNAWTRVAFKNPDGQWEIGTSRGYNGDQFYIHRSGLDPAGSIFAIQPDGNTFIKGDASVRTLTIRGGADLAEPFPMKEQSIEKGSVVVIDDAHPGRLQRSTRGYDTRVAGIVSGANSINPGISLKQEGALDQGRDVALTGRVYVQADASTGAIKPGDLLTTSDTPGHAMKVSDATRAQGAILGKAMSNLEEGRGMVLVLVTLQ